MSQHDNLENIKYQVQKILDNHLWKEERFSIDDLDETWIFLLIDLLLENDESKREDIFKWIYKEYLNSQENIKLIYENILMIADKLEYQKDEMNNLNNLVEDINNDTNLSQKLANI